MDSNNWIKFPHLLYRQPKCSRRKHRLNATIRDSPRVGSVSVCLRIEPCIILDSPAQPVRCGSPVSRAGAETFCMSKGANTVSNVWRKTVRASDQWHGPLWIRWSQRNSGRRSVGSIGSFCPCTCACVLRMRVWTTKGACDIMRDDQGDVNALCVHGA